MQLLETSDFYQQRDGHPQSGLFIINKEIGRRTEHLLLLHLRQSPPPPPWKLAMVVSVAGVDPCHTPLGEHTDVEHPYQ